MIAIITISQDGKNFDEVGMNNRSISPTYKKERNLINYVKSLTRSKGKLVRVEIYHDIHDEAPLKVIKMEC